MGASFSYVMFGVVPAATRTVLAGSVTGSACPSRVNTSEVSAANTVSTWAMTSSSGGPSANEVWPTARFGSEGSGANAVRVRPSGVRMRRERKPPNGSPLAFSTTSWIWTMHPAQGWHR